MGSTGLVVTMGGIVFANNVVLARQSISEQRRVIVGTVVAALALAGVDQFSEELGRGIAGLALITTLFARVTPGVPSPIERVQEIL